MIDNAYNEKEYKMVIKLNRFISTPLIALVLLCSFSFPITLAASTTAILTVGDVSGKVGDEVEVPVKISNNPGFTAFTLDIKYDRTYIEAISVKQELSEGLLVSNLNYGENKTTVRVAYAGTENYTSNNTIYFIIFKIKENVPDKTVVCLTLAVDSLSNEKYENITYTIKDGKISVTNNFANSNASIDQSYLSSGSKLTSSATTSSQKPSSSNNSLTTSGTSSNNGLTSSKTSSNNTFSSPSSDGNVSTNATSSSIIKTLSISGRLFDTAGKPIANKKIEIHSSPKMTITDTNGYYKFENVEFGEHILYIKDDSGIEIANLPIVISQGGKTEQNSNEIIANGDWIILDLTLSGNTLAIKSISSTKSNSNNMLIYIIIAILLIGAGIFMGLNYLKKKKSKKMSEV
jgi:hypothetical protein